MKVEILNYTDQWQAVKDAAMNTIGIENGKYPSVKWKRKMLLAEHSPIRLIEFTVRISDIPYWQCMHLVRHKIGIEHFVSTQRTDRTGENRNEKLQSAPVDYTFRANAQAFISISRKRLCAQAAPETRRVWQAVIDAVREVEPEIASVCVPECVYRGRCFEMKCCGYYPSEKWLHDLVEYRTGEKYAPADAASSQGGGTPTAEDTDARV